MAVLCDNTYGTAEVGELAGSVGNIRADHYAAVWPDVEPAAAEDTVSASRIYGCGSYPAAPPLDSYPSPSVTAGWGYQTLVILLLLAYIMLALRYRREAAGPMSCVWGPVGDKGKRKDADMPPGGMQFLAIGCGLLTAGVGAMRLCELWGPAGIFSSLPPYFGVAGALGVAAIWLAVIMVQQVMLKAAGSLTFRRDTVRAITMLRFSFLLSLTLTATPCALFIAISPERGARIAAVLFAGVIALHAGLYVARTFSLFVQQKVSILLWFLYLCAVEAMPPGIAVIGLMRSWPV